MPPKNKFTKQDIINAALNITREKGIGRVTARAVGEKLNASPKVIFGLFDSMDSLVKEVKNAAYGLYLDFTKREVEANRYPVYKSIGMAYIRFAYSEKELFRLLFMCDKEEREAGTEMDVGPIVEILSREIEISKEEARLFHLEMWMFTHGIASTVVTSFYGWDDGLIEKILTDCYIGLKYRFKGGC